MEALVHYMHAAAGFPVKSTWLKSIKHGNYNSWPGLTYKNAAKYFPQSVETIKGHIVQSSQGVRSTKKTKHQKHNNQKKTSQETIHQQSDTADILPQQKTKEIHIWDQPIRKFYTDDCCRFPIRSQVEMNT